MPDPDVGNPEPPKALTAGSPPAADNGPASAVDDGHVPLSVWAIGLGPRSQVLLAGLLVDRPELRSATNTPEAWSKALADYEQSPTA